MQLMNDALPDARKLEAFAAVMSAGSITAAARLIGRSQSVVTRMIQELEDELGYALLHRHGPRIAPTPQGVRFHDEAERVLVSLRQLRARAEAIRHDARAPIEIAAIPALAAGLVPAALARLGDALPDEVHVQSGSAEQVVQSVLGRRAEIGLTSLPVEHSGLDTHWIGEAPCVAALAADDPLAAEATVPLASLAGRRLLTMANPFRLRRRVQGALAAAGVAPRAVIAVNASVTALLLARAGLGIAIVEPATAYGAPLQGGAVRPLDIGIPFLWSVVTAAGRPLPAALVALVAALRAVAEERLPRFRLRDPSDPAGLAQAVYGAEEAA